MDLDVKAPDIDRESLSTGDLSARAGLLLVTVLLVAFHAPTWFATPMVVVTTATVLHSIVRGRCRGGLDGWIAALGGLLTVLVLLALILNLLPGGLGRISWAIGLGVVGILALVVAKRAAHGTPLATRPVGPRRVRHVGTGAWYGASAAVLVIALIIATRATNHDEKAPLALSVQRATGSTADVVITSSRNVGPYLLKIATNATNSEPITARFEVTAGQPITRSLTVPVGQRVTVQLTDADTGTVLRSVILDPR